MLPPSRTDAQHPQSLQSVQAKLNKTQRTSTCGSANTLWQLRALRTTLNAGRHKHWPHNSDVWPTPRLPAAQYCHWLHGACQQKMSKSSKDSQTSVCAQAYKAVAVHVQKKHSTQKRQSPRGCKIVTTVSSRGHTHYHTNAAQQAHVCHRDC